MTQTLSDNKFSKCMVSANLEALKTSQSYLNIYLGDVTELLFFVWLLKIVGPF